MVKVQRFKVPELEEPFLDQGHATGRIRSNFFCSRIGVYVKLVVEAATGYMGAIFRVPAFPAVEISSLRAIGKIKERGLTRSRVPISQLLSLRPKAMKTQKMAVQLQC